jgi:hypothetical protein
MDFSSRSWLLSLKILPPMDSLLIRVHFSGGLLFLGTGNSRRHNNHSSEGFFLQELVIPIAVLSFYGVITYLR